MSGLVSTRLLRLRIAGALLARRVAVVDRRAHRLVQAERVQRARLVLGQRLGRVQVQRARACVGAQDVERRQVEAQRLARRGAGGDDRRPVERREQRLAPGGRRARSIPAWSSACSDAPVEVARGSGPCASGRAVVEVVVDEPLVLAPGGRAAASHGSVSRMAATSSLSMAVGRSGRRSGTGDATVAPAMRCLYVDLDGTLLGPNASLFSGAGRTASACSACARWRHARGRARRS